MGDPPSEEYARRLRVMGVDHAALTVDSKGSIVPGARRPAHTPPARLPELRLDPRAHADLAVLGRLGEGGMGEVLLATQVALQREVAVKRLHPGIDLVEHRDDLTREALVLGRLEHPNVVPVHLLGQTADGAPLLVMKRIEGVSWAELLRDPARAARYAGDEAELLGWHLDVLMRVCNAVHFAHDRGVLHRDIKPENVMIGAFGEVYVVDWGIAVSLRDDDVLPTARNVDAVAGTPEYMAPEMARGDGAALGPATDVYLLGATLHRVLTGEGRHKGDTVFQRLLSAFQSEPVRYGPEVPDELAAICNRATRADPAQRYATAEELRRALAAFVLHRTARALSAQAEARRRQLDALLTKTARTAAVDAEIREHFAACRFGFQQSLAAHPEDDVARKGLHRALVAMIGYECDRENPSGAEDLLRALDDPPAALAARVEAQRAQWAARSRRLRELEQMRTDVDLSLATRGMPRFSAMSAAIWGSTSLALWVVERRTGWRFGYAHALPLITLFAVVMTALSESLRRRHAPTAAQHRLLNANIVGAWCFAAFWFIARALSIPFEAAEPVFMFMVSALWAALSALFDARALGVCVAFGVGALVSGLWPPLGLLAFGAATAVGFLSLARAWRGAASPLS